MILLFICKKKKEYNFDVPITYMSICMTGPRNWDFWVDWD